MNYLQLIGRILFGMIFVLNGITGHFLRLDQLSEYAASKGVPLATVMVIITGIMIVAGGLSVILGYKREIGLWLLVAFLIPTAFIMHNFWAMGPDMMQAEMAHFLKDSALGGAALIMLAFATDKPWPYSLDGSGGGEDMGGSDAGGGGLGGGMAGGGTGGAAGGPAGGGPAAG